MLAESPWHSSYMLVVFYCEGLGAFSFLHVGIPLGLGNYTSASKSDVERTLETDTSSRALEGAALRHISCQSPVDSSGTEPAAHRSNLFVHAL